MSWRPGAVARVHRRPGPGKAGASRLHQLESQHLAHEVPDITIPAKTLRARAEKADAARAESCRRGLCRSQAGPRHRHAAGRASSPPPRARGRPIAGCTRNRREPWCHVSSHAAAMACASGRASAGGKASGRARRCHSRRDGLEERSLNVDDLVALHVHTHAEVSERGQGSLSAELQTGLGALFGRTGRPDAVAASQTAADGVRGLTVTPSPRRGSRRAERGGGDGGGRENADVMIPVREHRPGSRRRRSTGGAQAGSDFGVRGFSSTNMQAFYP